MPGNSLYLLFVTIGDMRDWPMLSQVHPVEERVSQIDSWIPAAKIEETK
jgi:hypothetical protein